MARGYIRNVFIGLDQLVNTVLGGYPDESLSSRCGRLGHRYPYKAFKAVIDVVFLPFQGPNHCENAYKKEKARYQFPPEMRDSKAGE